MNEDSLFRILQSQMQNCSREIQTQTVKEFNDGMSEFFSLLYKYLPAKYTLSVTTTENKFKSALLISDTIPIIEFERALKPYEALINCKDETLITEHGESIIGAFSETDRKEWRELVPLDTRKSIMEHISELYYGAKMYTNLKSDNNTSIDDVKQMFNVAVTSLSEFQTTHGTSGPKTQSEMVEFLTHIQTKSQALIDEKKSNK